ncbi:hypothetical protein [Halorubrum laminariae]|uniref:Class I SAM-dependent methyltransferase n=1 Tax=Halorubrum laminariae TaxID=1433523 RepID=A0ABD6BXH2_9EURY|nr:hypothetical protein [Halorubrum laminariae]
MTASFRRYLRAKRTVDDRAIDRRIVGLLRERLTERAAEAGGVGSDTDSGPLHVLEVGAGVGTMVARLIDWEVLPPGETRYVAVDRDGDTLSGLVPFLREWAADRADVSVGEVESSSDRGSSSDGETLVVESPERTVAVEPVVADAAAYAESTAGEWDALIGMALLDVLGLDRLDPLLDALAPGGTYYFPITFDGATRFRPPHPDDRAVERLYHRHMDEKPGGNSRAGGDALARLRTADGSTLLGVAGSDWIVRPSGDSGGYPDDEASFLRHILDTVEDAVGEVIGAEKGVTTAGAGATTADSESASLSSADLDAWLRDRRDQIDASELIYLTHQLDLLGRVDGDR